MPVPGPMHWHPQIRPESISGQMQLASLYQNMYWREHARVQYELVLGHLQPNNFKVDIPSH